MIRYVSEWCMDMLYRYPAFNPTLQITCNVTGLNKLREYLKKVSDGTVIPTSDDCIVDEDGVPIYGTFLVDETSLAKLKRLRGEELTFGCIDGDAKISRDELDELMRGDDSD